MLFINCDKPLGKISVIRSYLFYFEKYKNEKLFESKIYLDRLFKINLNKRHIFETIILYSKSYKRYTLLTLIIKRIVIYKNYTIQMFVFRIEIFSTWRQFRFTLSAQHRNNQLITNSNLSKQNYLVKVVNCTALPTPALGMALSTPLHNPFTPSFM